MAEVIQQIGAYAGFAAIVGLAVLSALYFSQARDLKRLREWAARAPDRTGAPARSAGDARPDTDRGAVPRSAATPGRSSGEAALPAAAGAATAASAPPAGAMAAGDSGPRSQRSPAATALRAGQPPPSAVGAPTQAGARPVTRPPSPGGARDQPRGGPQRGPVSVARPEARPPSRPTERSNLPYVALAVVGVLIVVGAGAFAIGLIGGGEEPVPNARSGRAAQPQAPVDPASVTFSVLNGTGVDGLAKQVADELEAAGYRRGNVTNASQQKAESAVLYAQGARADAQAVARELDISQIEASDSRSRSLAGDSSVVVVVGADQTR